MHIGKYELVSRIAAGGMAEVFLARAQGPMGFEKTLVLKRILPHLAEDPVFVEMFLAEAKLAAQLNHPNIVQIFEFGEAQGEYFLTMEHIDGLNLRVLLKGARALGKSLPPELCARIIASACEGLDFAHDFRAPTGEPLGLVHRDVSTDNILVSRQGAVKVVDFGIAKAASQSHKTRTGVVKGKLAYMPPEQIQAKPPDRRLDIYALGVVLYELLTGHKPFKASSEASLMQAILFEPQVPAVQRRPDLPASLQRILERALAKDREERYPSCRAFQTELEDFILSTGKAVGAYQIAELVTEVMSTATLPERTPAPGSNPGTARSYPRTVQMVTPAPRDVESRAVSVETRAVSTVVASRGQRKMWIPALMGAALLVAGGGYVLAGTSTDRGVATPPVPLASPVKAVSPALTTTQTADEALMPPSPVAAAEPEAPPADEANAQMERPEERRRSSRPAPSSVSRGTRGEARQPGASQVGTLHLVMRGWADIWVDGKKMGRVPPINELELPPGRHEVELINPAVRPYRAIVTITAGKTLEHSVVFQAAGASKEEPQAKRPAPRDMEAEQLTAGAR